MDKMEVKSNASSLAHSPLGTFTLFSSLLFFVVTYFIWSMCYDTILLRFHGHPVCLVVHSVVYRYVSCLYNVLLPL